ncbi:hypothetical protein [Phenylobacterium sp.]|uniref:hypothetical protein n=1 Tax=Phenylobacterium sp. TaxID=1871053 RepID=UPI00262442B9|nr:hypothetical protein [Phenylobacterium sp.]
MRKPRPSRRSAAAARAKRETLKGWLQISGVVALTAVVGVTYFMVAKGAKALDDETLCPREPSSVTVLLVDVTDPMTTAQKQDFQNQLDHLRRTIPRYGKLIVTKVDSSSSELLKPIIVRCNPGTATDVSEWNGNPRAVQEAHDQKFVAPLEAAFKDLSGASGADRSPILESIQSVALTELAPLESSDTPRKVVVVSDLLQNTDAINFYDRLPSPDELLESAAFRRVRTDLSGVQFEIWMLERSDATTTQPRALVDLWDSAIAAQGGSIERAYNVSG